MSHRIWGAALLTLTLLVFTALAIWVLMSV